MVGCGHPKYYLIWSFVLLDSWFMVLSTKLQSENHSYHWGTWSPLPLTCSVTCGRGLRCRWRKCLDSYGNVQSSADLCRNPEDYESKAETCTVCVVSSRCPTLPGWGAWGPWGLCIPRYPNSTKACQPGIMMRSRNCDSPPPEPPPRDIPCVGVSRQTTDCLYNCGETKAGTTAHVAQRLQLQMEEDHRKGLTNIRNVLRRRPGDHVRMTCETPTYRLAKRLSEHKRRKLAHGALSTKELKVTWYKNGEPLKLYEPQSRINRLLYSLGRRKKKKKKGPPNELLDENDRWRKLLPTSDAELEDVDLLFLSVTEGDQGFYTCELSYDRFRGVAMYYSLLIVGTSYEGQSADPFYLHSNLGYNYALQNAPVWFEASELVWKLNAHEFTRGIAIARPRRIMRMTGLNQTHQGTWRCYLIIPSPGSFANINAPRMRVARYILVNEFQLKVKRDVDSLWQLAEFPKAMKTLRNVNTSCALCALFLFWFLLLTVWAAKRWIERSLTVSQKKAIVQEIVDNECRLLLTARKRAGFNKERLLPLILQEHQRLELANRHLVERLLDLQLLRDIDGRKKKAGDDEEQKIETDEKEEQNEEDEVTKTETVQQDTSTGNDLVGRVGSMLKSTRKTLELRPFTRLSLHKNRESAGVKMEQFGRVHRASKLRSFVGRSSERLNPTEMDHSRRKSTIWSQKRTSMVNIITQRRPSTPVSSDRSEELDLPTPESVSGMPKLSRTSNQHTRSRRITQLIASVDEQDSVEQAPVDHTQPK
ncbi:hypothetical protein CSKR_112121 [Clonorchis sinensis]|uniref:Uncharacterized protein n=1 Tax=Clonorchis sinensis TaxID=79923 RepID=A0A3R7C4Q2_CLOSI|nr:hypothetical protein CSKR_112121 [Clonorchis sinensis]